MHINNIQLAMGIGNYTSLSPLFIWFKHAK